MELGSKRFADAVVLYPVGRIDHATVANGVRGQDGREPLSGDRVGHSLSLTVPANGR